MNYLKNKQHPFDSICTGVNVSRRKVTNSLYYIRYNWRKDFEDLNEIGLKLPFPREKVFPTKMRKNDKVP